MYINKGKFQKNVFFGPTYSILAFLIAISPIWGRKKNFFKVWHVGTQNLRLEMLITAQKSVFNFDHPSRRKCPICAKIQPFCSKGHFWSVLGHFLWLGWSKLKTDFCAVISISSFKFWVPTCHTLKKFFFGPQIGLIAIKIAQIANLNDQKFGF